MKKTPVRSWLALAVFISLASAGCGKEAEEAVDLTGGTLASRTTSAGKAVSGAAVSTDSVIEEASGPETVSEDGPGTGSVSGEAVSGGTVAREQETERPEDESPEVYIAGTGNISFANMTGRNLTELEVQFTSGEEQQTAEVLQGNKLYDGSLIKLDKGDYSILWESEGAGISARAVDTAGNVLEFPEIYLWTPDDVCFSLTQADDGYALYVE